MVALVHFSLLARIKVVNSDPRVRRTTGHESVTQVRVERSGCDGVRKRDGNWRVLAENVEEINILARCNAEGTATVGEFHARDGFTKVERGHLAQCSKVPPSENRKKLVLRHCRRSRKKWIVYPPNFAIFGSADTHSSVLAFVPNKTLNNAFARQAVGIGAKHKRFSVRSAKVEKADFFFVSTLPYEIRQALSANISDYSQ